MVRISPIANSNFKIVVTSNQNPNSQLSCSNCKHTQGCKTILKKHQATYTPTQSLPQVKLSKNSDQTQLAKVAKKPPQTKNKVPVHNKKEHCK